MAERRLLHVSMIITASDSNIYDLMTFCEGRVVKGTLDMRPVKHGGTSEEGKLKEALSPRAFITAFAQAHDQFTPQQAVAEGSQHQITKASIYAALSTLVKEKTLKRIAPATYAAASKVTKKGKSPPNKGTIKPGGVKDQIIKFIASKQNGDGHGVSLDDIKGKLKRDSVSPYITDLVKNGLLTRTGPGEYRAAAHA